MIFKAHIVMMPTTRLAEDKLLSQIEKAKIPNIKHIQTGRHFSVELEANSKNAAMAFVDEVSHLLVNEDEEFEFTVNEK